MYKIHIIFLKLSICDNIMFFNFFNKQLKSIIIIIFYNNNISL
jgi:hypothetical protein